MSKSPDTQKWGKDTAKSRYGSGNSEPSVLVSQKTEEAPQDPSDKRADNYSNNAPNNWLRGMPSAEGKPGFDKSKAGK